MDTKSGLLLIKEPLRNSKIDKMVKLTSIILLIRYEEQPGIFSEF
jgi:hypothetical protein